MCSPPKDQAKELLMPGLENTRLLRDIHSLAQCALANGHENESCPLIPNAMKSSVWVSFYPSACELQFL